MVPSANPGVTVLITNTNVKHELTGGEYTERHHDAKRLPSTSRSPRWVGPEMPSRIKTISSRPLPPSRRCRRRDRANDPGRRGNCHGSEKVGTLMYGSHDSLAGHYEVSSRNSMCSSNSPRTRLRRGSDWHKDETGGAAASTVTLVRTAAKGPRGSDLRKYRQQPHRSNSARPRMPCDSITASLISHSG